MKVILWCWIILLFPIIALADDTVIDTVGDRASDYVHQTDIYLFYGEGYQYAAHPNHTTIKFQNIATFSLGDTYFFFSADDPFDTDTTVYGKWDPRLSFGKIFRKNIIIGPVTDVLLAGEISVAENSRAYAGGFGFDLKIPGFNYATINIEAQNRPSVNATSYLIHPVWDIVFHIRKAKFDFTGYGDIVGAEGSLLANQHFQPEFLYDLGNCWHKPNRIFTGFMINYWHHKFGLAQTESVFEYTLKARF